MRQRFTKWYVQKYHGGNTDPDETLAGMAVAFA